MKNIKEDKSYIYIYQTPTNLMRCLVESNRRDPILLHAHAQVQVRIVFFF